MRSIAIILSVVIFSQSLSVCGPEIAHHKHHSLISHEGCSEDHHLSLDFCQVSSDVTKAGDQYGCCADKSAKNHNTSDSSGDEKDCCGDACHCFCCAKVLLNFLPVGTSSNEIPVSASVEPCSLVVVHSFDFHQSIANPPQDLYLS